MVPLPALVSDVSDVAYLSWWVDAGALPRPPAGYRYWTWKGRTPFTVLTYRHGCFGPAFLGPMRRLFPSPSQSNWRWYVLRDDEAADAVPTVLFARNVMDSLLHVVGARLWSDAMQPQLAFRLHHRVEGGNVSTVIDAGTGVAPTLATTLEQGDRQEYGSAWVDCFGSHADAVRFLACQDAAIAVAPDARVAYTKISLPIDPDAVTPLRVIDIACPMVAQMGASPAEAFCFLVPRVAFRVVSEQLL